jgi:hypothetical protein
MFCVVFGRPLPPIAREGRSFVGVGVGGEVEEAIGALTYLDRPSCDQHNPSISIADRRGKTRGVLPGGALLRTAGLLTHPCRITA